MRGAGRGLCPRPGRAHAPVRSSAYPYRRPPPPAQLRSGSSWCASVGPREGRSGEGRCALGEKAFSSDLRGSLGVPEPPAAAPPECAQLAHCGDCWSTWAEAPLPSVGKGGRWVCRPRGGAVRCLFAYCGPRLPPLRVGGGSRWAPPGVRRVGGPCVCRVCAAGPRGASPGGRGECAGRDAWLAPAPPAPQPW